MSNPRHNLDKNTKRPFHELGKAGSQDTDNEAKGQDETITDVSLHAHKKPKTIPQWPIKETRVALPEIANTIPTQEIDETSELNDGNTWLTLQFEKQLATYTTHNKVKNQLIVDLSKNRQITEGMVTLLIDFITTNKIIEINFVDSDFFTLPNSKELVNELNQHIHLQRCVVGENCVQLLAFPAHDMPIVLEFSKTHVKPDNIPAITDFIRTYNVIAANFDHSNIFEHSNNNRVNVEQLLEAITKQPSLKSLSLVETTLSAAVETSAHYFKILTSGLQQVTQLNLSGFLRRNFNDYIKYLETQNYINPLIPHLASLLRRNTSLLALDLSHNSLNEHEIPAIIVSLQHPVCGSSLQQLNLSNNYYLGPESAKTLSLWLATNPSLKQLNITGKTQSPESAITIIDSLTNNTQLESLSIDFDDHLNNGVRDTIITRLIDPNCTLRKLQIYLHARPYHMLDCTEGFPLSIITALTWNKSLQALHLEHDSMNVNERKDFFNILQQNYTLTTLNFKICYRPDTQKKVDVVLQRNKMLAQDKEKYWAYRACMTGLRRAYAKQKSDIGYGAHADLLTKVSLTSTAPTHDNRSTKVGLAPSILSYLFKETVRIVAGENQDTPNQLMQPSPSR